MYNVVVNFTIAYVRIALAVYLLILSAQFNPLQPITEDDPKYIRNPELKDRIHCLVGVLPATTFSMMDGEIEQMKAVREKARDLGE